ncbi:Forkhead box protein I3 [Leucoagaricus sp. SymC.cos]|nr:Forkhead box protein I3 [Leucoagaricus sp. SymC.cos]
MINPQVSPISQLLHTLGLTREDLTKRSDQMRQFLTADNASPSRVVDRDSGHRSRSNSDLRPAPRSASAAASIARSISRTGSTSFRDSTPPITPIKSEPPENTFPSRQPDAMEMVIERQRRQNKKERKSRKEKEREFARSVVPNPPSPSPSNASSQPGVSLDSFMQSRDGGRAQPTDGEDDVLPVMAPVCLYSPPRDQLKSPLTNLQTPSAAPERSETPANPPTPQSASHYQYHPYSAYGSYPLPPTAQNAEASSSALLVTPQTNRTHNPSTKVFKSPLPPSSPPPSSPISSPVCAVNLVSSPGPIGPAPKEDEYDKLPYTLPPGPYSTNKPDLSYAALVGQAILSSPEHRLTLQEIYDWITIVYPHFKRGETTWMNSIRHVLSTTVCFRKVPRDRSVGRTQWAIWDEDLECFKGGNFRKHLCKDYMKEVAAKEKLTNKGKTRARKRSDVDEVDSRRSKRARKDQPSSPVIAPSTNQYPSSSYAPLFPLTRPTPHHQPYYQSCASQPQTLPAEIIFPPLPAASAFSRIMNQRNEASAQSSTVSSASSTRDTSPPQTVPSSSSSTPTSSASSVPGLTPNRHSSSSPSMPATSDMDLEGVGNTNVTCSIAQSDSHRDEGEQSDNTDVLPLSGSTTLKPVRFWGDQSKANTLEPSINLLSSKRIIVEDEDDLLKSKAEGQRTTLNQYGLKHWFSSYPFQVPSLLVHPTSPTLERRAAKAVLPLPVPEAGPSNRPTTPTPSTPPTRHLQISSARTPLSHQGLHMSPTASLAHYKHHLDPPPTVPFEADGEQDPLRTPRKRRESSDGPPGNPMTPRKLFSSNIMDSPYRTPNGFGTEPFSRTPRSRPILDPQDPRTLLDDELNRMGTLSDSPDGLFGKSRSSLLYDSPGALDLPGKYRSWW